MAGTRCRFRVDGPITPERSTFIHKPTLIIKFEDISAVEFERFTGYGRSSATKNFDQDFYRVCRGVLFDFDLRGAMPRAAGTCRVDGVEVDVRTCSTPSPNATATRTARERALGS